MGKPRLLTEPSPRAHTGSHCKRKYYLHCQAVAVFVISEDELGEDMPLEGTWSSDGTHLSVCESYLGAKQILLTSLGFRTKVSGCIYVFLFR